MFWDFVLEFYGWMGGFGGIGKEESMLVRRDLSPLCCKLVYFLCRILECFLLLFFPIPPLSSYCRQWFFMKKHDGYMVYLFGSIFSYDGIVEKPNYQNDQEEVGISTYHGEESNLRSNANITYKKYRRKH